MSENLLLFKKLIVAQFKHARKLYLYHTAKPTAQVILL